MFNDAAAALNIASLLACYDFLSFIDLIHPKGKLREARLASTEGEKNDNDGLQVLRVNRSDAVYIHVRVLSSIGFIAPVSTSEPGGWPKSS